MSKVLQKPVGTPQFCLEIMRFAQLCCIVRGSTSQKFDFTEIFLAKTLIINYASRRESMFFGENTAGDIASKADRSLLIGHFDGAIGLIYRMSVQETKHG